MKRKNGFLTLCFAFIPGAGQMYQGYMKRGLSLVTLFGAVCLLSVLLAPLSIFACIIVMYSFFDTFNLRAQLLEGTAPEDDYLLYLKADTQLHRLLRSSHKLVGWTLVAVGVYALYDNFMSSLVYNLWNNPYFGWLARLLDRLPTLLLCAGLIVVGLWLVRGPRTAAPEDDIHYYGTGDGSPSSPPAGPAAPFDMGEAPAGPEPPRPFAQQPWAEQAQAGEQEADDGKQE